MYGRSILPCVSVEDCVRKNTNPNSNIGRGLKRDSLGAPQASLTLSNTASGNNLCYDLDSIKWDLNMSGSYDEGNNKINWTVNVVKSIIASLPTLKTFGVLSITNTGSAPADIGNIVINLQRKDQGGQYYTFVSDIADVTNGDLFYVKNTCSGEKSGYIVTKQGTSSVIVKCVESSMSGPLTFWNEDSNSIFSIVGGFYINPGDTKVLLYEADFYISDATLDHVRIETYVTFGNAGGRGGSGASANGVMYKGDCIAYDNVRSVPFRVSLPLPPLEVCNESVTLTSLESDVTATSGSWTDYTNDIGVGGVEELSDSALHDISLSPDPKVSDTNRTITACAKLTSPDDTITVTVLIDPVNNVYKDYTFVCCRGIDLDMCVGVDIPGSGGSGNSCGCQNDGYKTYTQGGWGAAPHGMNPGALLQANFPLVYPLGYVKIGRSVGSYYATFTSSLAVQNFLPAGGTPDRLTANLIDPTTTSAGVFAGQVLALQLNVDFSAAGLLSMAGFGNLFFQGLTGSLSVFNGQTVSQALATMNDVLGGGQTPLGVSVSDLNSLATSLNESFDNGQKGALAPNLCPSGQMPCTN